MATHYRLRILAWKIRFAYSVRPRFHYHREEMWATLPHWFLLGTCMTFATVPWLRYRFSLRTLLIATTLVAVVLGLIVYAVKSSTG